MSEDVTAQIQYATEQGNLHSDLSVSDRTMLHDALNEWLDKADGSGFFLIGDTESIINEVMDW